MSREPTALPEKGRFRHFPRTLRECVNPSAKAGFKAHGFADGRLLSDWSIIVGAEIASQCQPLRIRHPKEGGGTLTLQVAPGFAPIIQHQEPLLLERIAAFFGFRAIVKINLVQAPLPKAPTGKMLSITHDASAFLPAMESVKDAGVQSALASLAAAMAARKQQG